MNTQPQDFRRQRPIWIAAILAALVWVISVISVLNWTFTQKSTELRADMEGRLDKELQAIAWGINQSLDLHRGVPQQLAQAALSKAALRHMESSDSLSSASGMARTALWTQDPVLAEVNRHLKEAARNLRFSALWIMNAAGDTIAASNAGGVFSFVGSNFAERHYFKEAQAGRFGYQYARGKVSNVAGIYFSAPVIQDGGFLGAVVGKINVRDLGAWVRQGDIFLTDSHGVVILANERAFEMRTLAGGGIGRLDARQRLAIYGRKDLSELPVSSWGDPRYPDLRRVGTEAVPVILMAKELSDKGLTVHAFKPLPQLIEQDRTWFQEVLLISLLGVLLIGILALTLSYVRKIKGYGEELRVWREDSEAQIDLAIHVMSRLTATQGLRDPMLHSFNIPAQHFSGDLLCAARAPGGLMNVMLADATGHGLPAALSAMPLTQIFYSMTAKGFPLNSVVLELNRKLKAILPADRFVAATLASVDVHNQTIEVWNGGGPDAFLIDHDGTVSAQWPSRYLPLGILPEDSFQALTETVRYQGSGVLVIYSDGLIEAESPSGEALGIDGLKQLLSGPGQPADRYARLLEGTKQHLQSEQGHDDISCLILQIPVERRQRIRCDTPAVVSRAAVEDWRLEITYSAQELRYVDVVPALLSFITQIAVLRSHQGSLFLIISELFNNALDYGLLRLDSSVKGEPGGFEFYMQERERRLNDLRNGQIRFDFQIHTHGNQAVVDIEVKDSGPGFDVAALDMEMAEAQEMLPYGRGISLLRELCDYVTYLDKGNSVRARYLLGEIAPANASQESAE